MLIEICSENIDIALKAQKKGALRVELCNNISIGGVTPSYDEKMCIRDSPHIHVLTGIRRSGKSSLFRLIINHLMENGVNPREILTLNLDEPIFTPIWSNSAQIYHAIEQAEVLTGTKVTYLFLDEVQQVTNWELFVKGAYDTRRFKKIYVTGSTSDLLQRQFATSVSYTHLDVYKRQSQRGGDVQSNLRISSNPIASDPVSYTHLDVYKRQQSIPLWRAMGGI